jgi:aspartate-semialdehyde dehydrogenase
VPLLIPEVNADHLGLLPEQKSAKGWKGAIVTNPNCATVVLAMALAPLRQFGINKVCRHHDAGGVGRGVSRCASLDILGNIIPFIGGGEEEKIETRDAENSRHRWRRSRLNAVSQRAGQSRAGHRRSLDDRVVELLTRAAVGDVVIAMRDVQRQPQALKLPTAPVPPIVS